MEKTITQLSPEESLDIRMKEAFKKLHEIAIKKTEGINANNVFAFIGYQLGITGQTVSNYVYMKIKTGNGYLIDALIVEFKKYKPNGAAK